MSISELLSGKHEFPNADTKHIVLDTAIMPPFPEHTEQAVFCLGCFWGAEQIFWQLSGIYTTMVGYAGGSTPKPTYQDVCSGQTGHCEVVGVIYDPQIITYSELLKVFWEGHDPTQGMRQGNDAGTQYRSVIYTTSDAQLTLARQSQQHYQRLLSAANFGTITTEIEPLSDFYYAETYHQQYLAKNPAGYCPHHATGVAFTVSEVQKHPG